MINKDAVAVDGQNAVTAVSGKRIRSFATALQRIIITRGVPPEERDSAILKKTKCVIRDALRPLGFLAMAAVIVTLLAVASAACGYHLRGTGSSLPPQVKTMAIPIFLNQTTRYELDVKLTRAVIDEMVARSRVNVITDTARADAVLSGEIVSFIANPIAFTDQTRADNYNVTVVARIELKDRATQKVLFSNPTFTFNQAYTVPVGRDFESVQTEAIDQIAPKFARSLVATILEGF